MACGTSFVSLGKDGGAADREHALTIEMLREFAAHELLRAIQLHWRKEVAVRQLWKPQRLARDSYEILDVVVPGRDICIADGPIDGYAVT